MAFVRFRFAFLTRTDQFYIYSTCFLSIIKVYSYIHIFCNHLPRVKKLNLSYTASWFTLQLPGLVSDAGRPKSPLDPTTNCHPLQIILLPSQEPNPFLGPLFDDPENAARGFLLMGGKERAAQITVMVFSLDSFFQISATMTLDVQSSVLKEKGRANVWSISRITCETASYTLILPWFPLNI